MNNSLTFTQAKLEKEIEELNSKAEERREEALQRERVESGESGSGASLAGGDVSMESLGPGLVEGVM